MSQKNATTRRLAAVSAAARSNQSDEQSVFETLESIHDLATHISAVLNHPLTPREVYSAITDRLLPLFDEEDVIKSVPEIDSAQYVERTLLQWAVAGRLDLAALRRR